MLTSPLFWEAPSLSPRGAALAAALSPVFLATAEESLRHRASVEAGMEAGAMDEGHTYGEVDLHGFLALLEALAAANTGSAPLSPRVFVDLGCGLGKSLLIAAAFFPSLTHAVGYDINPALCASGADILATHWPKCVEGVRPPDTPLPLLSILPFDVCDPACPWAHADIVFTYWNAMGGDTRRRIAARARSLPPGSLMITTRHSVMGADPSCCVSCGGGGGECVHWAALLCEWVDFERLPHETVFVCRRR